MPCCAKWLQLYPIVAPWTLAHQVPLAMGFFRQEYWSGLPFPAQGSNPHLHLLQRQADSLPLYQLIDPEGERKAW